MNVGHVGIHSSKHILAVSNLFDLTHNNHDYVTRERRIVKRLLAHLLERFAHSCSRGLAKRHCFSFVPQSIFKKLVVRETCNRHRFGVVVVNYWSGHRL